MRRAMRWSAACIPLFALAACGGGDKPSADSAAAEQRIAEAKARVAAEKIVVPVSFAGVLPCADCPGIETALTLFADSTFRLREVYQERRVMPVIAMGRWAVDGSTLVLDGLSRTVRYAREGTDTLRLLDRAGRPIESGQPLALTRRDSVDALREAATFVGTFTYQADAPLFRECASGQDFPVLMQGAYRALERAYRAAKLPPGSGQQVEVRARFLARPATMEGPRDRDVVEVLSYVGPSANPDCR